MRISGDGNKYKKVWKVEQDERGFVKADIGDSSKKKDGTYENFTWFGCTCFGKAKDLMLEANKGDTIEITGAEIKLFKTKDGQWKPNMVIFDFEFMTRADATVTEDDDLPY